VHQTWSHLGGVDDEEGVHDRVDARRLHDAGEDGVVLVGAYVLGAFELYFGLAGVEADQHIDGRIGLESLCDEAAPERGQTGDEDAPTHLVPDRFQPNHTERRSRSMS
jgi:hypothetical protein